MNLLLFIMAWIFAFIEPPNTAVPAENPRATNHLPNARYPKCIPASVGSTMEDIFNNVADT